MDEKYLICYFQICDIAGDLELITVNAETKQIMPDYCQQISSKHIIKYFEDFPNADETVVKAVIFNIHYYNNELFFKSNSEFFRFLIQIFKKKKIPYRFITKVNFNLTTLLKAAKILPKIDKNIMVIIVGEKKIYVEEVSRTLEGYIRPPLKGMQIIEFSDGYEAAKIKAKIFENQTYTPDKIIMTALKNYSEELWKNMYQSFQNCGVIFIKQIEPKYEHEAMIEIANYLLNKKDNEFYVIPSFTYIIRNLKQKFCYLIECDLTDGLPFKETYLDKRKYDEYCIERYFQDEKEREMVQKYPILEGQYHQVKLTFTVDKNMEPKLTQEPYIDPLIEKLPEKLTEKMSSSKIPIIGFFFNSSIICLWNQKENGYKFCQNWNGLYGEDLFISFDEEKPKYRNQAMEILAQKSTFVVYDLLSIMSAKPDNIYVNPEWLFTITKDEENPILLEFDNFDGTRKLATPEFLMALLLKDHLKVIKEEIGTKPAEIGIVFFDKIVNTEFWDAALLEAKIKASCSLIKLGCKIINVDEL